jgi:hypothetical protein
MSDTASWVAFVVSSLIFFGYEGRAFWIGRRQPERVARSAHRRMRAAWVAALSAREGFEIVAVQSLRNSLMSATIAASTAALALMGSISLAGISVAAGMREVQSLAQAVEMMGLRLLLEGLLILVLFASYVASAMAMRYFNHASFVMSIPVSSPERVRFNPMAVEYVERAGLLYSWGLRFFLMIAPLVAGIVNPLAMPPITIALVAVLWKFDQPARLKEA